jgi:phosphosulfolactate synthase (CoM biosynthesis protein A)
MMKAAKGKKIDDNEKREMREQKIERAQNHVKSGIRDNEFEARQKYKQQMYDSQNRADKKLNVDRARSAQIFQSNMQRKHV